MFITEICSENVKLSAEEIALVEKALKMTGEELQQKFGFNRAEKIFCYDVRFHSGKVMYVNIVNGDSYETPYCQAVLLDETNSELTYSEVREDFFGEWQIIYRSKIYRIWIEPKGDD